MENFSVFSFSSGNLSEDLAVLLQKAKTGDAGAFGQIYDLYFQKIYRFIYYRVGHKEQAEDLTEDVFLKVYAKLSSKGDDGSFEGWLYKIARNTVIDFYRAKKTTVSLEEVENTLEYEQNLIDIVNSDQQQRLIIKCLKQLSPDQQMVIKMKFFEQLDTPEIALLLDKSEGAIRVIQHRALARLQEILKEFKDALQ
jgi:RNA polymerase sigma-70 factor (ECF subfamily)